MQATGTPSDGTVLPASIASSGNFSFPQLTVTSSASLLGGAVFNENGADVDFRVEGDTVTHLLFVDADADRVGIGTSSPSSKLTIEGAADNVNSELKITATGISSGYLGSDSNGLNIGTDTAGIFFKTGVTGGGSVGATGSVKMAITSAGLVGIGETNPAGSLHINAASGVDGPVFESGGTNNTNHAFIVRDSAATQLLRINNNGNVGIGTTSPDGKLDVRGTIFVNGDGTGGRIFASSGNLSLSDGNGRQVLRIDDPGASNSHSHIFDSNGRLGIGTTSPTCKLQVDAGSGGDGTVTFLELNHGGNDTNDAVKLNFARAGSDIGSIVLEKVASNNTTDFIFNTRALNTVSESMRITGGGSVNIGSSTQTTHMLYLQSAGEAGIHIRADSDNSGNENDNPYVSMSQDGSTAQQLKLGMVGDSGQEFAQSVENAIFLHANSDNSRPLQLAHMDNLAVTFSNTEQSHFHSFSGNSTGGVKIANRGNDTAAALLLQGHNNTGTPGAATNTQLTHLGSNLTFEITHNGSRAIHVGSTRRIRLPGVPGVAGSGLVNVSIESDGNLCTQSSLRAHKINITSISDTSWLYNLNPVTFNWRTKTEVDGENVWGDTADNNGTQYGLIAEEVETVKKDFCYYNNNDELSGVHYDRMIAPLIKVLQEQKAEIDTLKTKVAALEAA
jgi:hypothetical protein